MTGALVGRPIHSDVLRKVAVVARAVVVRRMLLHFAGGQCRILRHDIDDIRKACAVRPAQVAPDLGVSPHRAGSLLGTLVRAGLLSKGQAMFPYGIGVVFVFPVEQVNIWVREAVAIHEAAGWSKDEARLPLHLRISK